MPILNPGQSGNLTLNVALSNQVGTTLGSITSGTLTILDTHGHIHHRSSSVTLASSNPSSEFTEPVTFTATVSPAPHGHKVPTGYVQFFEGTNHLGLGAIDTAGQASFTTISLDGGTYSITAHYSGDSDYQASTSSALSQYVDPDPDTTTSLALASANPSVFGQSVSFVATVAVVPPGMGTPTGTVNFMDKAVNRALE